MQRINAILNPQGFFSEPISTISNRRYATKRARWNIAASNYCRPDSELGLFKRLKKLINP